MPGHPTAPQRLTSSTMTAPGLAESPRGLSPFTVKSMHRTLMFHIGVSTTSRWPRGRRASSKLPRGQGRSAQARAPAM